MTAQFQTVNLPMRDIPPGRKTRQKHYTGKITLNLTEMTFDHHSRDAPVLQTKLVEYSESALRCMSGVRMPQAMVEQEGEEDSENPYKTGNRQRVRQVVTEGEGSAAVATAVVD